jgi:hypothetical protein
LAKSTLSTQKYIGKYRKQIEWSESMLTFRAMASSCCDTALATPNPPNKHRGKASEESSKYKERNKEERSHDVKIKNIDAFF